MMTLTSKRTNASGVPLWQYDRDEECLMKGGRPFPIEGEYAFKRLRHLAQWDKASLQELLDGGDMAAWAEEFDDAVSERIHTLYMELERNNPAYRAAQDAGDIVTAARLSANDRETAKQVVIREMVLTDPVDGDEEGEDE